MDAEQIEHVIWLQQDAAYLYQQANLTREVSGPASYWVSSQIQVAAAHSSKLARIALGIESA